jgi:protocatechuate 3,4-dioxygenase beta subunit
MRHRRHFLQLVAGSAVSLIAARLRAQPVGDKWIEPPGVETADEAKLIDAAVGDLRRSVPPSTVLCDARYMRVHAFPRYREAVRAHATSAPLTIAAKDEPGERAVLRLTVVGGDGKPLPGALVYAYQTSARGWYSDRAAHIRASSGDQRHARLFGYVKTDRAGVAEMRTIRPGGYPDGALPQHVHVELHEQHVVTEVVFTDDARFTAAARENAIQNRFLVTTPVRGGDGTWQIAARLALGAC